MTTASAGVTAISEAATVSHRAANDGARAISSPAILKLVNATQHWIIMCIMMM